MGDGRVGGLDGEDCKMRKMLRRVAQSHDGEYRRRYTVGKFTRLGSLETIAPRLCFGAAAASPGARTASGDYAYDTDDKVVQRDW